MSSRLGFNRVARQAAPVLIQWGRTRANIKRCGAVSRCRGFVVQVSSRLGFNRVARQAAPVLIQWGRTDAEIKRCGFVVSWFRGFVQVRVSWVESSRGQG